MKRDMDLVRDILLAIEAAPKNLDRDLQLEGHDAELVSGHVKLLKQAGYIEEPFTRFAGGVKFSYGLALTWEGHEFLETIRDPQIWKLTKSGANKVGSWSLSLVAELAKGAIRQKAVEMGLPLGI